MPQSTKKDRRFISRKASQQRQNNFSDQSSWTDEVRSIIKHFLIFLSEVQWIVSHYPLLKMLKIVLKVIFHWNKM